MKVTIPEEFLSVILREGKSTYIFYDNRDPLDELTISWQWNGKQFSDGRHVGVWLKFMVYLEECKGTLKDFNIPYPQELEIHGQ
ncbi:MAG: hypothetical protein Q8N39_03035 [Pelolinea sp.]|nr:hypothetical protein [Pelolinea sp.]